MTPEKTNRGFDYLNFTDLYEKRCSLQRSSLATEDSIWLGVDATGRMGLSREQVAELLPYLQKFVDTGEIV